MKEKSERTQCFRLFFCKWEDTPYMKKSVYRIAASMTLLFALLMLAGFAPQDDAARDMEELSRALLHDDAAGMKKFGYDREKLRRKKLEDFTRSIEVAAIGVTSFTEDLIHPIYEAFCEAAGKCEPKGRILSKEDGRATVEISFKAIDCKKIDAREVVGGVIKSGDNRFKERKTRESFMKRYEKALRELEPSELRHFRVNCVYDSEKGVWVPENSGEFLMNLFNFATGSLIESDPAESIKMLSAAWLRQDWESVRKASWGNLMGTEEVDLHGVVAKSFSEMYKRGFDGGLSDGQARMLSEATLKAMGRVDIQTRTLRQEGTKAQVEITVETIDPFPRNELLEARKRIPPGASKKEVLGMFVAEVIDRLEHAKPRGKKTIVVECVYYGLQRTWVPADMKKFFQTLLALPVSR